LILEINATGIFRGPVLPEIFHVDVKNPRQDHPRGGGWGLGYLPVGSFSGTDVFFLENTDKSQLMEYHDRLREIAQKYRLTS